MLRCVRRRIVLIGLPVQLAAALVIQVAARSASLSGHGVSITEALRRPVTGPLRGSVCPAGAVSLAPGASIQRAVNTHPGRTTFCLKAGVHTLGGAITPKTGNTFVGELGAILDGTGWKTTDSTQGAFRAHNEDIDDVTIRNLVIRSMPQRGIHAFSWASDRWTIEHNEIAGNNVGVLVPHASVVRANYIHHNVGNASSSIPAERGGGYIVYQATDVVFEQNELAHNGSEQKVTQSSDVTFRGNFVHHNEENGIWYDGDNVRSVIEANIVEDHPGTGVFYEISGRGVIRQNAIRRSGDHGVLISTSQDVEVHHNMLEDNFRGIQYFLNCGAVGGGAISWDLTNNTVSGNAVSIGAKPESLAAGLSHTSDCAPGRIVMYMNASKRLEFVDNRYIVPSADGRYWLWGSGSGSLKSFSEWQGIGHDRRGARQEPRPLERR